MLVSTTLFSLVPCYLLLRLVIISLAIETRQSSGDGYGLCRVYSYNIQRSAGQPDERHFFVCCSDAGDEVMCHDQTLQSPRRHEGNQ